MGERARLRLAPLVSKELSRLDEALGVAVARVTHGVDAEAVHDLRVTLRRIRCALAITRPLYGRWLTRAIRKDFSRLQRETGPLRDEEVLVTLVDARAHHTPAVVAWLQRRRAHQEALRRQLIRSLQSGAADRPRALLHAIAVLPVKPSRNVRARGFARKRMARKSAKVRRASTQARHNAENLHALRIAHKELRYAGEFLKDALPRALLAKARRSARAQHHLGEQRDRAVVRDVIRRDASLSRATRKEIEKALLA